MNLGLVIGVGLLVAALNVVYRDVQYIVDSILTVLFWVSPILYASGPEWRAALGTMFPASADWVYYLYHLNPLAGLLEAYRSVLFYGRTPEFDTFGMTIAITLVTGFFGIRSFWKHEREFADLM